MGKALGAGELTWAGEFLQERTVWVLERQWDEEAVPPVEEMHLLTDGLNMGAPNWSHRQLLHSSRSPKETPQLL